jgi:epoxyqueuosine reductase QueG
MSPEESYQLLKKLVLENGVSLFGVADLDLLRKTYPQSQPLITRGFKYAVVGGYVLSRAILDLIEDKPTFLYTYHYKRVNFFLDQLALKISAFIQEQGFSALPIPSSQITNWQEMTGEVSHKLLAQFAGLGWRGRNNLLINPSFGAQVRLVSVLTNFPLRPNAPFLQKDCHNCQACLKICPAQAIEKERFKLDLCRAQLKIFSKQTGVHICGLCVKICQGKRWDR